MRHRFAVWLLAITLLMLPALVHAQIRVSPPQIGRPVVALPASCPVGDVVFLTSGSIGLHECKTLNTWTATGGGGGGNPFDQDLNTTDSPTFDDLTLASLVSGTVEVDSGSVVDPSLRLGFSGPGFYVDVTGVPAGIAGSVWATNKPAAAATAALGAAGTVTNGAHQIWQTFLLTGGEETDAGLIATITVTGNAEIDLSNLEQGNSAVTDTRLYMTPAGQTGSATAKQVVTLADGVTTYTITDSDGDISGNPAPPTTNGTGQPVFFVRNDSWSIGGPNTSLHTKIRGNNSIVAIEADPTPATNFQVNAGDEMAFTAGGLIQFNPGAAGVVIDGTVQGAFKSSDGTAGLTQTCAAAVTAVTIKNGLITAVTCP